MGPRAIRVIGGAGPWRLRSALLQGAAYVMRQGVAAIVKNHLQVPGDIAAALECDLPRRSIHPVQGAGKEPRPHDTVGVLMNRADPAGGETIGLGGIVTVGTELFLLEIEDVEPLVQSAHPQQAGPVPMNGKNLIVVEASRVGCIVLKAARETSGLPIEVE